ncbi:16S rRNA (cytidine1402-2'-O)-methyltransferase [Clostridium acetobutylicum]|uniref:Ribosomal RNA small subunit methyltransferase I n=1 Tax=Clostridium acetobutylicum (strain ATCC 824 / DSM 792 / JCM 1419 / IAM 19013 / LMG 5710 / NBRC 13948 / NRRL B-527 / VKM B-1787 / 2291 / W) TaxID=272562 RepID=Q97M91_CLOAB|nr:MULTISPECIES: 16S rRNA (cytidine(1402)-2'-O)-methyltransferase [Clostridium]AAK78288.1 Predicted methyltransferase [Clostridium acetobutylicum ATCC 824]ADZ19355.1 methyltransferase [Clostridium acetobutylicum EA 2018]AEI33122.1 methyltransferase [Clostridium acetobutylicum DSM 1731]AWV80014.1 16S rRNA (cytidine(1402)-2'-O)-methyltransferase [Clostridium acetobutylicum]MBC2395830.1 16S rRNA (cytidine(1402)-2'-O)-methyltransferase [Clostridium acetobutylicum]
MNNGKLFLVGTPIGNLKDITLRALETLQNCDVIAAEDTRQSLKLLNHFDIKKPLISYHKFNENNRSSELMDMVREGKKVALVTDAGMPGISDPGSVIVEKFIENNLEFEVIPGPTALITALVYSGLDTSKFVFRGFLPKETKDRKIVMEEVKNVKDTLIFYEAPHKLLNTLGFLFDNLGDREIAICRELTKLHEEIKHTTLKSAIEFYESTKPKGEYVLIIEGKSEEEIAIEKMSEWQDINVEEHIIKCMEEGLSKKEAIKKVAKARNLSKSEVYKYSIGIN